ncbi:hypothetical protein BDR06DRAFT_642142 [Suillus hirtellus]|nr:hypothetical protein BDR06DRAFT_642142 [Suillus hirtellus]
MSPDIPQSVNQGRLLRRGCNGHVEMDKFRNDYLVLFGQVGSDFHIILQPMTLFVLSVFFGGGGSHWTLLHYLRLFCGTISMYGLSHKHSMVGHLVSFHAKHINVINDCLINH